MFKFIGKTDDVDKAFGLWTQMQDEDVQPTDEFLSKLASILQKHDRPIPFAVPNTIADTHLGIDLSFLFLRLCR